MGQPTIHCDPDQLEARCRELERIRDGIAHWDRHNPISRLIASVGHPDAERRVHDFVGGWKDGMSTIHRSLESAATTLRAIVAAYRNADRSAVVTADSQGGAESSPAARMEDLTSGFGRRGT